LSASSFPGSAGSGICFTHTTTFMRAMLPVARGGVQIAQGVVRP
jgi:hypothetical protein